MELSVICKVLDWVSVHAQEIVTKPEILVDEQMKEKFFISHFMKKEKEVVCKVLDWVNAQDIVTKPEILEQMKEEFFISHFMKEEEEVVITAALDLLTY